MSNRTHMNLKVPTHAEIEWRLFNKKGVRLHFCGIIEAETWSQAELSWGVNRKELKLQGFYALPCVVYIAGMADREHIVNDQKYQSKHDEVKRAEIAAVHLPRLKGRKRVN